MSLRYASHAGSWYTDDPQRLTSQLDKWLENVPATTPGIGPVSEGTQVEIPTPGARIIIAPHAGYSYSGPVAAWAYKSLDWSKAKRVFILGPSHHHRTRKCELSQMQDYETPIGNLVLDQGVIEELSRTKEFDRMSRQTDEDEHSIEMHLPYVMRMLQRSFTNGNHPPIVPILVGATNPETEAKYGKILEPYLKDPSNFFVVSSDFAHWGKRFGYTYYRPSSKSKPIHNLSSRDLGKIERPICESIGEVDFECMGEAEDGDYSGWLQVLEDTDNTVCGRHPIGVVMSALESMRAESGRADFGKFKFVQYARSSDVTRLEESSVSYASGFAVL